MIEKIGGVEFKDMVINAAAAIDHEKEQLNELNVFPVPDGDTGTNMSLTIASAATALRGGVPATIGQAADRTAAALLRGARGNSGVILSLLFRGFSKSLKDKSEADAMELAAALAEGVEAAYKAVMKPAEGTILTVSRMAAHAAVAYAADARDIDMLLQRAIEAGYAALAETTEQNPVLKKAGVIDAGGKGYLIILEGFLKSLRGEIVEPVTAAEPRERAQFSAFETEDIHFAYCTEFIVQRENGKEPYLLRGFLDKLGDSIVVVDDDEIIKVHVHTNEPGHVLTEALTYGSFLTVKIENMKQQHTETLAKEAREEAAPEETAPAEPGKDFGVVIVSVGSGINDVFKDLGADAIITGGQTMNPSTEDILKAIDSTPARVVFVFPNNKNIIMAAQQCIGMTEKDVVIIPTKTVPQGVSALLAFDPSATAEENTTSMTEAMKRVHTAQITCASRDSAFDGLEIKDGEYLALLDSAILGSGSDLAVLIDRTADALAGASPEFVTVFYGEDVDETEALKWAEVLAQKLPNAEIATVYGGQPVYHYMISAE